MESRLSIWILISTCPSEIADGVNSQSLGLSRKMENVQHYVQRSVNVILTTFAKLANKVVPAAFVGSLR